jgi:tight adherence protein C
MLAELIAIVFFAVLMCVISYAGYRHYARPGRFYEHLGEIAVPAIDRATPDESPGLSVRILQSIGEVVPVSPEDVSLTRKDLIAAGYRSEAAVRVFYGIRLLSCVTLLLASLILRGYVTNPVLSVVAVVAAGLTGFFGPSFLLEHLVANRQERLRFSLPDALDLMVVSVEAGLALDQAIQYVARELAITHKELCEELSLVNLEIRAGKRRAEALRNLAHRTGESELRKLVAMLVQTDRFGTSVADSLRTHSDFLRVRRRQEAEERAGQVGVKLVFPIFFLVLPAMLVVSAGPGLLQVFKYLFPMMHKFNQG